MMENSGKVRKTLQNFKNTVRGLKIFNDAVGELPKFLKENLVDDARNIKVFKNDDHAYIRIFYFQFLKVCFEIEDVDYDAKINNFIELVEANLELLDLSYKYCKEFIPPPQLKDILFQFLELLSECKQPVQTSLSRFPAAGDILTYFFTNYLLKFYPNPEHENEDRKSRQKQYNFNSFKAIQNLSKDFQLQLVEYEKCVQFTDSQVYLLKENQENIYMIYIDQSKVRRNSVSDGNSPTSNSQLQSAKSIKGEYEVIKFETPDIVFDVTQQESIINIDVGYGFDKKTGAQTMETNQSSNPSTMRSRYNENTFHEITNQSHIAQKPQYQSKRNSNIFKIAQLLSTKKQLQNIPTDKPKKSNITRQFTNTFILDNIIKEPYRSQIKQMKNKVRNQRKAIQPFLT